MRKGRKKSLHVDIEPRLDRGLRKVIYKISIDGDLFWADSYDSALHKLMYIICRDEFKPSKIC